MPKVLIREYDKSTTGFPGTDNFAVVVPGYFGTPGTYIEDGETKSYNPEDILVGHGVYELKSQADFNTYIGAQTDLAKVAVPPSLVELHDPEGSKYNDYSKFFSTVTPADFSEYLAENPNISTPIYQATVITDSNNPKYGKKGYLYDTIKYFEKEQIDYVVDGQIQYEKDEDGNDVLDENDQKIPVKVWVNKGSEQTVTFELTRVTNFGGIRWESDSNGNPISVEANFCKVRSEGSNVVQDNHMGNQIAYELLGLGYTVLFKKIDPIEIEQEDGTTKLVSNNEVLNRPEFWEPLKDKSVFNFRYVMTGGYYDAAAMTQICNLAKFNNEAILETAETYGNLSGRGDCIALCDIDENIEGYKITPDLSLKKIIANIGEAAGRIQTNECSAIFGPKVTYKMSDAAVKDFGYNKTFPASFHYLACAARTFDRYNEWYAVAGYNRGISSYTIESTSVKLGEIAINTLAPRVTNQYTTKSINLILHERGNYYLWGNRTGYALDNKGIVFHHFLNIRQLCCSIKKQLYTACRQFTFDPNSDLLWINFVNAIKPTLEAMKADQGVKGYTITRVANDKKALLTARIRIVPIEAVEDFDISIYLEDSLTGIVVNTSEA